MFTGLSPALPGTLLCNATWRLVDGQPVIFRQSVRGSVRAVRAVWNIQVFQTETSVVADVAQLQHQQIKAIEYPDEAEQGQGELKMIDAMSNLVQRQLLGLEQ